MSERGSGFGHSPSLVKGYSVGQEEELYVGFFTVWFDCLIIAMQTPAKVIYH